MEHGQPLQFDEQTLHLPPSTMVAEELVAAAPPAVGNSGRTREEVLHDLELIRRFGNPRLAQAALGRMVTRPDV